MLLSRRINRQSHVETWLLSLSALAALFALALYLVPNDSWFIQNFRLEQAARIVKRTVRYDHTAAGLAELERDSATFTTQTQSIKVAAECFPVHIKDIGQIGVLYLYCSEFAYDKDGQSVTISGQFNVPQGIARRYNFWRRIYSLWGKHQYVMHLSQYPEVVLEAYDVSRLPETKDPNYREKKAKDFAKDKRDVYKALFLSMHRLRDKPEQFTPAMKRLAAQMQHIKDNDKYLTAAHTLRLQRGQRDFIASGLSVAPRYLPAIEKEFVGQGIPIEITRLAFVESSFNLRAQSKVGASGVYQLMPATGRQYLKMHSGIDERNDPIKASRAAAKLLQLNYKLTGSWPLAITAYNHGVGGIRRAIKVVGSDDLVHLIQRYEGNAFGFASKNFYASFLGVLATLKDADRLFPEVQRTPALAFDNLRIHKATSVLELRKKLKVSVEQLAELNPDVSRGVLRNGVLPAGYVLKIPSKAPTASGVASVSSNPNS